MDDEYASEITQIAVARACVALGFKQCEKSVIESLADIVQHYIRTLGVNAQEQTEISGRVHAGIQDIIPALTCTRPKFTRWQDLGAFAFEDVKNPTMESSTKWCQPFPFDVPNFPVPPPTRGQSHSQASLDSSAKLRDPYIPAHLPPFPPAHTFKRSSTKKRAAPASSKGVEEGQEAPRKAQRSATIKSAQNSLAAIEDSVDSGLDV